MGQVRNIPLIDFSSFRHGSLQERQQVAAAVDGALSSTGFFQLKNHGIVQTKVDKCFHLSKHLFSLPDSAKAKIPSPAQSNHFGYSGIGDEKIREKVCMKENFECSDFDDWLVEEPIQGLRDILHDFFEDCAELSHHLFDCLSLALNSDAHVSLAQYHDRSNSNLSLIHYPVVSAEHLRSGNIIRIPAHSDFGTLTLLFQDDVGGLEIADMSMTNTNASAGVEKSGEFLHVDPVPGTIVVNAGYLLMRWSNGRWKNTVHRVTAPPTILEEQKMPEPGFAGNGDRKNEQLVPERYSIGFFSKPTPETVVEALPGCWDEETPKRWKSLNAGEFIQRKRAGMYTQKS